MVSQGRKRLPQPTRKPIPKQDRQNDQRGKVAHRRQNAIPEKVAHVADIHHAEIENVSVVRFGNEYWAVANLAHKRDLTREEAEAARVCRFPFIGPAKLSNMDAQRAYRIAVEFCRVYLGLGESQ